jgi:hypothetical protein
MTDTLAWLGVLFTLGFGVLSIFLYARGRRIKRIACLITSTTLQKRVHPDVQISFRGQEVANLSRMVAYFWNTGTAEIRSTDVPHENWPRLTLPEGAHVLSAAVLRVSTDHIQLKPIQYGDQAVCITFTYLNPGDGAIFEVLLEASPSTGSTKFAAPLIGGRSPDFGELPAGFGKDIRLSLLESAGGVISGIAFATFTAGGRTILAAAALAGGLIVSASAFYLDQRRLHRRLPGFAHRYLEELAAA